MPVHHFDEASIPMDDNQLKHRVSSVWSSVPLAMMASKPILYLERDVIRQFDDGWSKDGRKGTTRNNCLSVPPITSEQTICAMPSLPLHPLRLLRTPAAHKTARILLSAGSGLAR